MDHNVRGFNLEFSGVGDVGGYQGRFFSCSQFILFIKVLKLVVFHAAFFKEAFHFGFSENNWFRFILLGFDEIVKFLVDLKDCVICAVITKGFFYQGVEGVTLVSGRKRCGAAKNFIHHCGAEFFSIFCVVEHTVNICTAVIELWEKKSPVRHFYQPVADTVFDIVGLCVIVKACLGELYRADAAEDVVVDLIGCIEHFGSVGGFARDIVDCMNENDVIVFAVVVVLDDLIVEGFCKGIVCELAFTEFHKEVLGSAFGFLFQGEFHVDEILANCACESFAEDVKVFEHFFL